MEHYRKKEDEMERGRDGGTEGGKRQRERDSNKLILCLCLGHAFSLWFSLPLSYPTSGISYQTGWSQNQDGRFPADNHWAKPFQYKRRPDYRLNELRGYQWLIVLLYTHGQAAHMHTKSIVIFYNRSLISNEIRTFCVILETKSLSGYTHFFGWAAGTPPYRPAV